MFNSQNRIIQYLQEKSQKLAEACLCQSYTLKEKCTKYLSFNSNTRLPLRLAGRISIYGQGHWTVEYVKRNEKGCQTQDSCQFNALLAVLCHVVPKLVLLLLLQLHSLSFSGSFLTDN